jgi:hypothetical protein
MKKTPRLFREITNVYHFPDGKTDVATFVVGMEPKTDMANAVIYLAIAKYTEKQFSSGAIKLVTTCKFV